MPNGALRRTIRRCTAVLAIPLSLYPMVFVARLETDGYPYINFVLDVADQMAGMVLVGAVVYLVGSAGYQFLEPLSEDADSEREIESE